MINLSVINTNIKSEIGYLDVNACSFIYLSSTSAHPNSLCTSSTDTSLGLPA